MITVRVNFASAGCDKPAALLMFAGRGDTVWLSSMAAATAVTAVTCHCCWLLPLALLPQFAQVMMSGVPADVSVWGWKHPHAMYTLPHLLEVKP